MLQQINRLRLFPLTSDQLLLLAKSRNELEKHIGLSMSNLELNADEAFINELTSFINHEFMLMVKSNEANFEWYTHWLIIHDELNLTIGGIGMNGLPDNDGQVMIGYYIDKKFEGKGYGTEAVKQLLNWMKSTRTLNLKSVIADTLVTGLGSQKVLLKSGFEFAGNVDEGFRWQYNF